MTLPDDRQAYALHTRLEAWVSRSTPLLIAVIVLITGFGTFGAVRAWFPRPGMPATTSPGLANDATNGALARPQPTAASAHPSRESALAPNVTAPTAAGRLSIVTDPAGARVDVDGRTRGKSPMVIDGLPAGEHRIAVSADSGTAQRTIAVANGVMTEVVFSPARPTAPVAGWVAVTSPFPVDVIEHDEVIGTSGTSKIMLAAGRHDVVLRNESVGFDSPRTIDVAPGRVAPLEIVAPTGVLNVNARPWADVLIDGDAVGQTPLANVALPIGAHQITFRHPQLGERTERIVISARGVNRIAVDLNQ